MPARLRDIAREAAAFGVTIDEKGGKHNYKARRPGRRAYPIPAHNGWKTEVTDKYIRGMCRNLGIDEAALFEALGIER